MGRFSQALPTDTGLGTVLLGHWRAWSGPQTEAYLPSVETQLPLGDSGSGMEGGKDCRASADGAVETQVPGKQLSRSPAYHETTRKPAKLMKCGEGETQATPSRFEQ